MTRPATGTLLRGSVPALGGLALGGILQAADPRLRLYVAGSPALVAVLAGLAGTAVTVIVIVARRRAAAASAASERVIRVTVPRAPWPLPLVEGDRDLLFIAVQNLVANAVKFSAPGDTVEVRASEDDDALLLEVADTGAGIPADEIGQVWQELARGRAARSLPGTGIGLALVRATWSGTAARSRFAAGTARAPWSASGSRYRTVPGLRRMSRACDKIGIRPVWPRSSLAPVRPDAAR
jgi:anti-sigma regulatory factor (Ser/Thr protein kinase)